MGAASFRIAEITLVLMRSSLPFRRLGQEFLSCLQNRLPLAVLGGAMVGLATPVFAGVDLPQRGVICDSTLKVCYDDRGASIPLTGRYYGRGAEQNLMRALSGRPPANEIPLSNGMLCEVRQRTCWADGARRKVVNPVLTGQLFGSTSPSGNNHQNHSQRRATCELRQFGRTVFQGPCELSRHYERGETSYLVETRDGRRYSFFSRRGQLVLRDASGVWPVGVFDQGRSVQFRWADLQLEASRQGWQSGYGGGSYGSGYGGGGYGSGYGSGGPGSGGYGPRSNTPGSDSVESLIDGLFN
jgi:hypothetical protein